VGGWEKQSRRGNHLHKGRDPPVAAGIVTVSNRLQDLLEQRSTRENAMHDTRGALRRCRDSRATGLQK
jgi:hypothetical protein